MRGRKINKPFDAGPDGRLQQMEAAQAIDQQCFPRIDETFDLVHRRQVHHCLHAVKHCRKRVGP